MDRKPERIQDLEELIEEKVVSRIGMKQEQWLPHFPTFGDAIKDSVETMASKDSGSLLFTEIRVRLAH